MSVATGTGTTAELITLYEAVYKLETMLHPFYNGAAQGGGSSNTGRFTKAEIDTVISAVSAAITAVNT